MEEKEEIRRGLTSDCDVDDRRDCIHFKVLLQFKVLRSSCMRVSSKMRELVITVTMNRTRDLRSVRTS